MALRGLPQHREVKRRTLVLLQHHPWHLPKSRAKAAMEGLRDCAATVATLAGVERGLLLHGHLHRRIRQELDTGSTTLTTVGSTSASLLHENPHRVAGYNVYEFDDEGVLTSMYARCLTSSEGRVDYDAPLKREQPSPPHISEGVTALAVFVLRDIYTDGLSAYRHAL